MDSLPTEARRELRTVNLQAGYERSIGQIFAGEILILQSFRERTEWVTHLVARTGRTAGAAIVSETADAGQTNKDLLGSILNSVGAQDPLLSIQKAKDLAKAGDYSGALDKLVKSVTMVGPALDSLKKLSSRVGLEVWIDDDELVLIKAAQALTLEQVVLRPDSGLIGAPERVVDDKNPTSIVYRGKALLNPQLTVGRRIQIVSDSANGQFVVREVKHSGDSHAAEWYTEFECVQFGHPVPERRPLTSATTRLPPI